MQWSLLSSFYIWRCRECAAGEGEGGCWSGGDTDSLRQVPPLADGQTAACSVEIGWKLRSFSNDHCRCHGSRQMMQCFPAGNPGIFIFHPYGRVLVQIFSYLLFASLTLSNSKWEDLVETKKRVNPLAQCKGVSILFVSEAREAKSEKLTSISRE